MWGSETHKRDWPLEEKKKKRNHEGSSADWVFAWGGPLQVNVTGSEWPPARHSELVRKCNDAHMWSLREHSEVDGRPIPFVSRHMASVVMTFFVARDSGSGAQVRHAASLSVSVFQGQHASDPHSRVHVRLKHLSGLW